MNYGTHPNAYGGAATSPRLSHSDYTVACICRIAVELAPVVAMLDQIHPTLPTNGGNAYTLGLLGGHNIVVAVVPETMSNRAANVATQLRNDFPSIRFALLVGIACGIPGEANDIRLGDIVVSMPTGQFGGVIQFDMGKQLSEHEFQGSGQLNKPPAILSANIQKLEHSRKGSQLLSYFNAMLDGNPRMRERYQHPGVQHDQLFRSEFTHQGGDTCDSCDPAQSLSRPRRPDWEPRVHYGTIGSSNSLIKDAVLRDKLRQEMGILCVDIHTAGLMGVFPCLVIRGICDYADSHKNKRWQPYAAAMAAAYAKELLTIIPPDEVKKTPSVQEGARPFRYHVTAHTTTSTAIVGLGKFSRPPLSLPTYMAMSDRAPELRPTIGLEMPPQSPGGRRRFLRSSDDTNGEMTIETYLNRADPFRATSHPNPFPYPFQTDHLSDSDGILDHQQAIRDILASKGFPAHPHIRLEKVTKMGYPAGNIASNFLRIIFYDPSYQSSDFKGARDDVKWFLIQHGFHDVHVEIVNLSLCFQPSMFPIPPGHEAVPIYEKAEEELLHLITTSLDSSWRMLGLFLVGQTEEKAAPTVVVFVCPVAFHDWSLLEAQMHGIITAHCPETAQNNLVIEFMPGTIGEYTSRPSEDTTESSAVEKGRNGVSQLSVVSDDQKVGMGFSIGVRGDVGAGTAGGFVTLTQDGTTRTGILTNYHVVRPLEPTPSEAVARTDAHGSSLANVDGVYIDFFASQDVDSTNQALDEARTLYEAKLEDYRVRRKDQREMRGTHNPNIRKAMRKARRSCAVATRTGSFLEQMPLPLGRVVASSGKLLYEDKMHDWAFVEFANTSLINAFQSNHLSELPSGHRPLDYGLQIPETISDELPFTSFGTLTKGDFYAKRGRSTGLIGGQSNGVLVNCNWQERDRLRYDENGKQVKAEAGHTKEHVIFTKNTLSKSATQKSFAEPGDSGSFIVSANSEVCGLLYGQLTSLTGPLENGYPYIGAGLAMCMSDVLRSIELRTAPRDASGTQTGPGAVLGLANFEPWDSEMGSPEEMTGEGRKQIYREKKKRMEVRMKQKEDQEQKQRDEDEETTDGERSGEDGEPTRRNN
ncbi:hypothetical protein FQN50_005332 [Emmonsiellopsis sp. PD_5]|nr:hypothetical protein FQN50_005332 [Emmonsiellopsis sp. PD_5]